MTALDRLKEFGRLERVLAGVLAFTPLLLIAFDAWSIRSSISAYYSMDENQWFYFLLTVASMLFLVNGVIKHENYYNVTLGVLLAGVILFNQDDWTAIHTLFAIAFFGGNAVVIFFFSRGSPAVKRTFIGVAVVLAAAVLVFRLSLFWIEWLSLGVIATHYILDTMWVDYRAVGQGEALQGGE